MVLLWLGRAAIIYAMGLLQNVANQWLRVKYKGFSLTPQWCRPDVGGYRQIGVVGLEGLNALFPSFFHKSVWSIL